MMEIKDWITFAGLIIGPISAVCITLWYTRRTERRGSKERLFITLMIHRRANPIPADWVNGLNLIDVTFAGNRAVIDKWHEFYRELNWPKDQINWTQVGHLKLELLSEMAAALGYRRLPQTDIDRFYIPQAIMDQNVLAAEVQQEFLRVLKATKSLHFEPKKKDE